MSTDNRKALGDGFLPALTVRAHEKAARVTIPNDQWSFADCEAASAAPSETKICYPAGFEAGKLYELIYRAKDPLVMGLGFAAARDLADFLKHRDKDDAGTANPVAHDKDTKAIVMGSSQSGRMIRTLLHLGFNHAEAGGMAKAVALVWLVAGLVVMGSRRNKIDSGT